MKILTNAFRVLICSVFVVQLVGCGTIMYPDRKGQKSGKIDAGVAVLDGIGLLLFIVPGVIAFAVDFNNGTIYLPGTSRSSLDLKEIREVKFDPKTSTMVGIEKMVKAETGYDFRIEQNNLKITKLKSADDLDLQVAKVLTTGTDNRVALLK